MPNSANAWARRSAVRASHTQPASISSVPSPNPFARAAHQLDIERFALAHRLPAELDRLVAGLAPAAGDVGRFAPVAAEQDRGVGLDPLVLLAAQQPMDRLAEVLALEIPQGHVDGAPSR